MRKLTYHQLVALVEAVELSPAKSPTLCTALEKLREGVLRAEESRLRKRRFIQPLSGITVVTEGKEK